VVVVVVVVVIIVLPWRVLGCAAAACCQLQGACRGQDAVSRVQGVAVATMRLAHAAAAQHIVQLDKRILLTAAADAGGGGIACDVMAVAGLDCMVLSTAAAAGGKVRRAIAADALAGDVYGSCKGGVMGGGLQQRHGAAGGVQLQHRLPHQGGGDSRAQLLPAATCKK
jgi:hypothetical protein